MAIPKKKNKFTVPPLYDTSVFDNGGGMNIFDNIKNKNTQAALGQGMDVTQGVMQLGSQIGSNLSTSGIGSEVQDINNIGRSDILNTNTNIDSKQTNIGGQALSGAMTGAQAGKSFGAIGMGVGAGIGALAGGLSSVFGNEVKQDKADEAQQQWNANIGSKDRQFKEQDLKSDMSNYSANGGDLKYAEGGQMEQPLTEFNSGGTHEENINGGIQQGTGPNGKPNLVEEGETKHEDYIFSDRLKVTPVISKDFKLPNGLNGKTFAEASKTLSKESKERPNDPISNNGVKAQLAKLTAAQEGLKVKMEQSKQQVPQQGIQPEQQQGIPVQGQTQVEQQNPQANIMDQGENQQMAFGGYKPKKPLVADTKMKAVMQQVQVMIQQGASQEDIEAQLEKSGMSADQAQQLVMTAMQQMKGQQQVQQPQQQQIPQQMPQAQMQGISQGVSQMAFGGDLNNQYAKGGSIYEDGNLLNFISKGNYIPNKQVVSNNVATPSLMFPSETNNSFEMYPNAKKNYNFIQDQPDQSKSNGSINDYLRYTPAITNAITGISDMMQKPETVKYGRVSPERITARQDYQPVDTEWMTNKMNANYAGTRDQMINNAGGNRTTAMAGLSGINKQQQNAVGEAYLKAGDTNYQRRTQANQFNAGVEQQNVAAQNQAQQTNVQLAMQEADANARNRAAQRNASRNAIISGANTIGDIGRENFNRNTVASTTGYKYNNDGTVNKDIPKGTVYNRLDGKKEIYNGKDWILQK